MNAPVVIDLLEQAIECVRPHVLTATIKRRCRMLWSAAKLAFNLATEDQIEAEFLKLAVEVGLIDARGWWLPEDVRAGIRRHGREDLVHMLRWAARGRNPFETGSLQ